MLSRPGKCLLALMLLSLAAAAPSRPADEFDALQACGTVVPSLPCAGDPTQSYALYLPSHYSPDSRWPIIYAFDPSARGKTSVGMYKEIAEKYGFILAGSNNSRNGPAEPAMAAAQAVWEDTHRRFSIDKSRVYSTGLSGGARFATTFALYCRTCVVAGVIAQGAGYPQEALGSANDHFLYYATVGDADFNLPELLELRRAKEEKGAQFKIKIYPGQHEWAPAEVFEDAVEWLNLKAMQSGALKPDPEFISRLFAQTKGEADEAERQSRTLDQYYALRSLAVDFKGFEGIGTAEIESGLAALKGSNALKEARKREQHEIDRQHFLTDTTARDLVRLATAGAEQQTQLRQQITSVLIKLWKQANAGGADGALNSRAFNQLWVQGIEAGQEALLQEQLPQAEIYFRLMGEAVPDHPWPLVMLAKVRLTAGNKKGAIQALAEAVKHGLKNPASLAQDPDLQPLASDPAFRKIVENSSAVK